MPSTRPTGRREALLLFVLAVAGTISLKLALDQVIWKFAGPATLAITLTVLTVYLHRRGESWRELGLRAPAGRKGWLWLGPQTLLAVASILLIGAGSAFAGQALGLWPIDPPQGVADRWGEVEGNLSAYLLWMTIAWISGGLFEELFFRAFLISRLERAVKGVLPLAAVIAVIGPALVFGYGHMYYQGLRGLVVTGLIGVALGTLYLLYKRNLWPLILAHGIVDSLAFTALYLDADI